MNKLLVPLALSSILFASPATQASFNDAIANYEAGKYQEAFTEFKSLAEIGNKSAQYNLGFMYLDGLGTPKDLVKAYAWIKLSDEDASSKETTDVLKQLENYFDASKAQKALKFYEDLNQNYSQSVVISTLKPVFDKNAKGNVKFAKPISTKPASYPSKANMAGIEGFTKVKFNLDENGTPVNIEVTNSFPEGVFDASTLRAIQDWSFDVSVSDLEQSYRYTMEYKLTGGRYNAKARKLVKKFKDLSEKGDPVAQYYYAKYGKLVLKDEVNESELYFASAMEGIADSQHELGLRLLSGEGCQQDKEKGIKWLTKAASADLGRSQLKLSRLYSYLDTDEAQEKSKFWLERAYKSNDVEAALETAKRMHLSADYKPEQVIEKLGILDEKSVAEPLKYYELYADNYAKILDYHNAYKYQNKANKIFRRYGKVPQDMREKLKEYKAKRDA